MATARDRTLGCPAGCSRSDSSGSANQSLNAAHPDGQVVTILSLERFSARMTKTWDLVTGSDARRQIASTAMEAVGSPAALAASTTARKEPHTGRTRPSTSAWHSIGLPADRNAAAAAPDQTLGAGSRPLMRRGRCMPHGKGAAVRVRCHRPRRSSSKTAAAANTRASPS